MRRWAVLFIVFILLLLPNRNFAQVNPPAVSQQAEVCQPSKVHLRIKLKTGDSLTGDSLELNQQEVKICRDGKVQSIPAEQIKEVKSRQTAIQRFRHTARVVGLTFAAIIVFGLIRAAQEK